jgi:hypothetical protein
MKIDEIVENWPKAQFFFGASLISGHWQCGGTMEIFGP